MSVKKGDPVRVRFRSGDVVDAVYDRPSSLLDKCHYVNIGRIPYLALGGKHARCKFLFPHECRFVGPTPMVKKENSND